MSGGPSPRAALFGASGNNTNLGLHALMHATVSGLVRRIPEVEVWDFDDGTGHDRAEIEVDGGVAGYVRCGSRLSRRVHTPEAYANMRVSATVGRPRNPIVDVLRTSAAVLDVSGGDSFTDLYGAKRLRATVAPKRLALQLHRPLVLLPQTYGPFASPRARRVAGRMVRGAHTAWARDAASFDLLAELAGADFDPSRHRRGVDMAFLLERHEPPELGERLRGWIDDAAPLVGINVSGLLHNDPSRLQRFGITFDYRSVVHRLVRRLLEEAEVRIVFVDHVLGRDEHDRVEADNAASAEITAGLPAPLRARVAGVPRGLDACQTKWIASQTDWFCGTRMHATIGALSSGVPAAAIGYSMKTRAVFETCGIGSEVTDVEGLGDDDVVEQLWASWERRGQVSDVLARHLPDVRATATRQMDEIAAVISPAATPLAPRPDGERAPTTPGAA